MRTCNAAEAAALALALALVWRALFDAAAAPPPPPPPPPQVLPMSACAGCAPHAFGGLVVGVDLGGVVGGWNAPSAWWNATLRRHGGLLLVRNQTLSPAEQIEFTQLFGALETMPAALDDASTSEHEQQTRATERSLDAQGFDRRHVLRVANAVERGYTNVGVWWHSDGSMRDRLSAASIWHLVIEPARGGATRFTQPCEVFARADAAQRAAWRGLRTLHASGLVSNLVHPDPREPTRECLRINLAGTTMGLMARRGDTLRGRDILPQAEALRIVRDIEARFDAAAFEMPYRRGDVVVADGLVVAHHAAPSAAAADGMRVLHRTTVEGRYVTEQWRTEFRARRRGSVGGEEERERGGGGRQRAS
jgi:taurine dioxygenase